MFLIMSIAKKKFFKKVLKFDSKEGTKSVASKQELKFVPLDPKGFATQPTYQQVKGILLIAIDKEIDNDLLNIRSCIELEVYRSHTNLSRPGLQVLLTRRLKNLEN